MSYNDIIGTIGVGLILIAYFLNIFSLIKKDGKLYFVMNIVGASLACYASLLINYMPFIILEATWAIVSLFGIINLYRKN
ncbi:MAG: hypothetical protein ABI549_08455 [Flavobacterium sp.]|uniref:CBU_0592 family membrane protein n=1 Tax=Flavobacterium sp. TaxID=239 RepID=UPI003265B580